MSMLEQLDQDAELVIEITKGNGEKITTYDVGFGQSELDEFKLQVHE